MLCRVGGVGTCMFFVHRVTIWQRVRINLRTTEVVTSEKFHLSYKIIFSLLFLP